MVHAQRSRLTLAALAALTLMLTGSLAGVRAALPAAVPAQRTDPATATPPHMTATALPTPTDRQPPPTGTALPTLPPGAPSLAALAAEAFVPALSEWPDRHPCVPWLEVQNTGSESAKAILVAWSPGRMDGCAGLCRGPLKVECSGLLKPGATWNFVTNQLPVGAGSAVVYSFTTRTLAEIGANLGVDDIVADYMCEQLFFGAVGDCADAAHFRWSWAAGQTWSGVPMDKAYGGPIAVNVRRSCPRTGEDPALAPSAAYEAVSGTELGEYDPVFGGYGYYLLGLGSAEESSVSVLHVQNAGLDCASVELWFQDQAQCESRRCDTFTVQPGETRLLTATACVGASLAGSGWLRSSQPLAVAVDAVGAQVMTSYQAELAKSYYGWNSTPAWVGPVAYNQLDGWNTAVTVQNLSAVMQARAKLYLLDLDGDVLVSMVDTICPRGSVTFDLTKVKDLPGNWIGSLRVESQVYWGPEFPALSPPALAGLVTLTQQGAGGVAQAMTYQLETPKNATAADLDPADPRLDPAAPERRRVAIPSLRKLADGATEIGIANLVTKPGFTDFATFIYDQNGLLDFICQKLANSEVEYIDLARWGYVNTGFRGSAILSAVYWEHLVFNPDGSVRTNPVALGAVVIHRDRAAAPARDQAEASRGIPVALPWARTVAGIPSCPVIGGTPHPTATIPRSATPTPQASATSTPHGVSTATAQPTVSSVPPSITSTATPAHTIRPARAFLPVVHNPPPPASPSPGPDSTRQPRPTATRHATEVPPPPTSHPTATPAILNGAVHLPILNFQAGDDICRTLITVQSLGEEPTKAVLVTWGEPGLCPPQCAGPLKVECSGLIKPGSSWSILGAQIPTGTRSGAVYSFSARVDPALETGDDSIADFMCEQLFFGVVGDCDDYRRFKIAYDTGGEFAGIPMAKAYGAPIAVTVERMCPGNRTPGSVASSSYSGIRFPDGVAFDDAYQSYSYYAPGLVANEANFNSLLYLQNAGEQCASIEIWFKAEQDSVRARICELLTVAPGETVHTRVADCAASGWRGTAWVRSTERLALLSETIGEDMLATSGAESTGPGDPAGSGHQATVLHGPLVFDRGAGWTVRVAVQNLDRIASARVKVTLRDGQGVPVDSLTDWVFARNSRTFVFPMSGHQAGRQPGSLLVVSEEWRQDPSSPPTGPVAIAGQLTLLKSDGATPPIYQGAATYDLLPGAPIVGAVPAQGSGVLALPLVASDPTGLGLSTELAVTNLHDPHVGGSTRYQLRFYDASGPVATLCDTLQAGEARYFDAATLAGHLPTAFHGSAVVSATWWDHGGSASARVGLGAVAVQRTIEGSSPSSAAITDPVSLAVGVPLAEALGDEVACER